MSHPNDDSDQYVALDEEMYEVQRILAKRFVGGKVQYLVKWLFWDRPEDLTWEPLENLSTVPEMIRSYQQQQQANKSSTIMKPERKAQISQKVHYRTQPKAAKKLKKQSQKIQKQKSGIQKDVSMSDSSEMQQSKRQKRQKKFISLESSSEESSAIQQITQKRRRAENESSRKKKEEKKINSWKIGCVNHLIVKQNKIFYEVDIINESQQCIGVQLMSSSEVKKGNKKQLIACLQRHLEDYQMYKDYIT